MHKAILTIAALGLAAGPVLVGAPAFAASGDTVTIHNFSYSTPASVTPGATITVVNKDSTAHTVTADSGSRFNDEASPGSTTSFKAPSKPGRYPFHCDFHSNMHGVLVVTRTVSTHPSSPAHQSSSAGSSSSHKATAGGGQASQMHGMPVGAVATGGGSTSGLQDEGLLLAGAASTAAGLGLAGLALRLRRRGAESKA